MDAENIGLLLAERQRLLTQLEEAREDKLRVKDEFLSHVSHELRSPLSPIELFLNNLLQGLAGPITDQQREYLEIVLRNARQLGSMVDDLLEVTRSETGKLTVEPCRFPLAGVLIEVQEALRTSGEARGIQLSAALPAGLPAAFADPARVRQVLVHLIENAFKFTPAGGSVHVRPDFSPQQPCVLRVSVCDTGCGIAPEHLSHLFDRFYQVPQSDQGSRRGLGLGLYLCRELVSRMGGEVSAESLPRLQRLIADNPDLQRRLAELVPLIERRLNLLAQAIELHRRTPSDIATQLQFIARGKELMDRIRSGIAEMKKEEDQLLARRAEAAATSARQTQTIIVAGTSLALSLAFVSGFILYREMTVRRRAEDRFRTLLEVAPDSMVIVNEQGLITLVNAETEQMFGFNREELLGQPVEILIPERFRMGHIGYRQSFLSGPAARRMSAGKELLSRRKDGTEFPVEISLSPFQIHEGRFVTAAVRDITERKRTEQQIRILGERFERFFTVSIDMFAIAGPDGYFKRLNPAWEKTLGFTNDELLARPYVEFVHPEDRERTLAEAEKLRAGVETLAFENRYRCKDGSYRWLLWSARLEPESQLIYASARDLTEHKRITDDLARLNRDLQHHAAELEASNKELETFTYSVSHDLRAPLRHIDGFSRILLDDYAASLDTDARKFLELIRNSTQHMGRLVDDLLNLSRISRQEARPQIVGLATLLEEVLAGLRPELGDRNIEWQIGNLPFVECDPGLVKQVLANLLSNAVKYTRPRNPGVISVGVVDSSDPPVLFVRDNGVGFSMKYADKLFGVFQRLHRQEDFEGTGVGLATVQRIIHKHGGRIWAEAELDGGATFFFTLSPAHPRPVGEQFLQRGVS